MFTKPARVSAINRLQHRTRHRNRTRYRHVNDDNNFEI